MKYNPYVEYKDSGIEWIGDIPAGWEVKKLKYLCNLRSEKTTDENLEYIALEHIESKTGKLIKAENDEAQPDGESICFYNNDVLFCKLRPYLAKSLLPQFNGKCTAELLAMRTNSLYQPKYLFYITLSEWFIDVVNSSTYGAKMPRASWDFIGELLMPIPSLPQQTAIADYLDAETAKIASIISAKHRLIEKLQEKRSVVISHAVTKGLDPNDKMKPSGIEWIGDIPEGWEVKKLKYIAKLKTGTTPPSDNEEYFDGLFNWFTPADFSDEYILNESNRKISTLAVEDGLIPIYPTDSILIVGIGATLGKIGITVSTSSSNQQITAIITISKIYSKFIMYWLASIIEHIKNTANFTTLPILNNQALGNVLCNVPKTFEEQKNISDFLDAETAKIDEIIAKTKASIEKLNEYKTALISACVTGKIDVRGE